MAAPGPSLMASNCEMGQLDVVGRCYIVEQYTFYRSID
jgi:hypothetical protein